MPGKNEPDLRRLEALCRKYPDTPLTFIVTLRKGVGSTDVEKAGMRVERRIDDPPLLIGTMTANQALVVVKLEDVVLVEVDEGGVHALDASD